ncbi:hypothetical protein GALL_350780 [mine drainage metagenome]|uniref:Uncharacterized protein n=1 Tax=mine drainage metagenome TaxID=410659 RepID=A0A1J5QI33_9ZZZZ
MDTQPLEVFHQIPCRVVFHASQRQAASAASLVKQDDVVEQWVEEAPLGGVAAATRPPVEKNHRRALRIAA